jgi:hypothetical protein
MTILILNKARKYLNHKIYKGEIINNINILPGDPKGLPDDCFYYPSMDVLWGLVQ